MGEWPLELFLPTTDSEVKLIDRIAFLGRHLKTDGGVYQGTVQLN